MKLKKILTIFTLSAVITTSFAVTASALSLREIGSCHTFIGYLYGHDGYADASTTIEHTTSNYGSNAYVYIESLNSDGKRQNAAQDYDQPKAYTSVSSYNATGGYRSRHTVKDPNCDNRYLRLEV